MSQQMMTMQNSYNDRMQVKLEMCSPINMQSHAGSSST